MTRADDHDILIALRQDVSHISDAIENVNQKMATMGDIDAAIDRHALSCRGRRSVAPPAPSGPVTSRERIVWIIAAAAASAIAGGQVFLQ
jgi:hypothetical protein